MPYEVVEIQTTPNPNALKFLLDRSIHELAASYFSSEAAQDHPLAMELFSVPGVTNLLIVNDFLTVGRNPEVPWKSISGKVRDVLKKY